MKDRSLDPRQLDVTRLAETGTAVEGVWTAADLPRLVPDAPLEGDGSVGWRVRGERRLPADGAPQDWLHLGASARVVQVCQRCLQPMVLTLDVDRWIRFVADESLAEQLDEDSEDDVFALPTRGLDLLTLVEDELILALPIVPRHEACPQPLELPPEAPPTNPFQVLERLRTKS
jgi:uncharacterized protein